jgi:hypothetical protein
MIRKFTNLFKHIPHILISLGLKSKLFFSFEIIFLIKSWGDFDNFFLTWTILSFILIVIDFSTDTEPTKTGGTFMSEQGRYASQVSNMLCDPLQNKNKNGKENYDLYFSNRIFDICTFGVNLCLHILIIKS